MTIERESGTQGQTSEHVRRCIATKSDGERCKTKFGLSDEGYCYAHDPEREEERKKALSKGGRATAAATRRNHTWTVNPDEVMGPPKTAAEAMRWSSWATWAIAVGELDKGTGSVVLRGVSTFLKALEAAEVERKIDLLEATVEKLKKKVRP